MTLWVSHHRNKRTNIEARVKCAYSTGTGADFNLHATMLPGTERRLRSGPGSRRHATSHRFHPVAHETLRSEWPDVLEAEPTS
jgi:hypothetical protein